MTLRSETPPPPANLPADPPPDSDAPTTAQLKGDIDSGRTGDKVPVFDPALSPLGTDDEAAGRPPGTRRVALARRFETLERWIKGSRRSSAAHANADGFPVVFVGFIAVVALIFIGALSML